MAADNNGPSLEERGLVGTSYDSIFSIDVRLRKIENFQLPTRSGITRNQLGTFSFTFFIMIFVFSLVVLPITQLLGIQLGLVGILIVILGPPILFSIRVVKPFAHGKTLTGAVRSNVFYFLDDPVHRRGLPVKNKVRADEVETLHISRQYFFDAEVAEEIAGETNYTDAATEARLATGIHVDLQDFLDKKAYQHKQDELRATNARKKEEIAVHDRRGNVSSVYV